MLSWLLDRTWTQAGSVKVLYTIIADAVIGFEKEQYTFSEGETSAKVCARVFNPPHQRYPITHVFTVGYHVSPITAGMSCSSYTVLGVTTVPMQQT